MLQNYNYTANLDSAHLAIPALGKIRAGYFKGFETLVENLGGNPREILEHQGLDPSLFNDSDNEIECIAAVDLLEYASRHLEVPLFGLYLAELQDPDVFGCVMALARAAPNVRQALQCLIDFVPISASPECELEMVSLRQVVELRWRAHNGLGETWQVNYHGVLLMMKTLKALAAQRFQPCYVSLTLPIGKQEGKLLEERLGCKVKGKSPANAIAFPAETLDRPIATANKMLYGLLDGGLKQLRAASKAGFIEQVEANVRRSVLQGPSTLDDCAKRMGISARTLQKRLNRLGAKFADIVQNERIKLAKHSLRWSNSSLDEIAFYLGYSEQTSFGRAFKRSTGLTPNEFREQQEYQST